MQLEQKLALIQQMRQHEDLNNRRMGACMGGSYSYRKEDLSGTLSQQVSLLSSSFRLRFLLAIFLFVFFFYLDIQHISLGFLDSKAIESYVGENMAPSFLLFLVDDIH